MSDQKPIISSDFVFFWKNIIIISISFIIHDKIHSGVHSTLHRKSTVYNTSWWTPQCTNAGCSSSSNYKHDLQLQAYTQKVPKSWNLERIFTRWRCFFCGNGLYRCANEPARGDEHVELKKPKKLQVKSLQQKKVAKKSHFFAHRVGFAQRVKQGIDQFSMRIIA